MNNRFDNIFIITYGRSGSTLLSGLLNHIDGYLIRGENYNFVLPLFRLYERLMAAKKDHGGHIAASPTDPWWGVNEIDEDILIKDIRRLIDNVLIANCTNKPRVYGFKEIRYPWIVEEGIFTYYLYFLRKIYPKSGFIFNTRKLSDVLNSGWWVNQTDEQKQEIRLLLERFEQESNAFLDKHSGFCFKLGYEDLVGNTIILRDLFDFLGEHYDEQLVRQTLKTEYSYNNKKRQDALVINHAEV